jgi:proteasome lid subunit RPN8/RPN11
MVLEVTSEVIARLLAVAAHAAPAECCGLLLGRGERIDEAWPTDNVAADPLRHFEIDPAALIAAWRAARAGGPVILGYFHSHPTGHPRPSATDCAHASGDGRAWAIVAGGDVALWRDGDRGFEPLSYVVVDG